MSRKGSLPRRLRHGYNTWGQTGCAKTMSPLAIWAGQFRSLVIWVLIGAALVS
jgi:hypothetical protein